MDQRWLIVVEKWRNVPGYPEVRVLVDAARYEAWRVLPVQRVLYETGRRLHTGVVDLADVRTVVESEDRLGCGERNPFRNFQC